MHLHDMHIYIYTPYMHRKSVLLSNYIHTPTIHTHTHTNFYTHTHHTHVICVSQVDLMLTEKLMEAQMFAIAMPVLF